MKHRLWALALIFAMAVLIFGGYGLMGDGDSFPLKAAILKRGASETAAKNLVTAVYLDYRLFDTLLEALLLLTAVIGVSQFSRLSGEERVYPDSAVFPNAQPFKASHVMLGSLGVVYLLIALFGFYVISTGMDGPGGGFQGGTILAAILICAHFAEGRQMMGISAIEKLEKLMYIMILAGGMTCIICSGSFGFAAKRVYLLLMNVFIGVKVFSGLSIIYLRFMAVEMRPEAEKPGERAGADCEDTERMAR